MTTGLEKTRDWLQRALDLGMRTVCITVEEAKLLLATTEPVPPGELAEALARLDAAEARSDMDIGDIRKLIRAVRQHLEQPLAERVRVPQTEPPTWIGGMPDCPPPENEQPEADDVGGEVVVPLEPILETTLECRVKQVPDADSTSGYRVETSLVAQQPEADPELVAHYRCFGTPALRDRQADKQACLAETGRHIATIDKVLAERKRESARLKGRLRFKVGQKVRIMSMPERVWEIVDVPLAAVHVVRPDDPKRGQLLIPLGDLLEWPLPPEPKTEAKP